MEPKTKREAQQKISDLENRASAYQMQMTFPGSRRNVDRANGYTAEADRLRALLPTLPD